MTITYFKVDEDTQVEFNDATRQTRAIRKSEIRSEIQFLRTQLDALPAPVTNAELLAWAKIHYPSSGQEQSRAQIKARIDELRATLEAMRA